MRVGLWKQAAGVAIVVAIVGGCMTIGPTPTPSFTPVPSLPPASPSPAAPTPSPSPPPPAIFPLAVVTGLTNLKAVTSVADVAALSAAGKLVVPCGVEIVVPPITAGGTCVPADHVADRISADQSLVALLPAGLVEPATKVLPIGGSGPYGSGGADLFGDPRAREQAYPIVGRAAAGAVLSPAWLAYDPSTVWTIASLGDSCPDRGPAWQAIKLGKGWPFVFDGGTARYRGAPFPNPNPPAGIDVHPIVAPVDTGNPGALADLVSAADLTIADVECPIVPARDWIPNYGRRLVFSISSAVLPIWVKSLGIDLAYLAANHATDLGPAGVADTLHLLDGSGIAHTGLGLDAGAASAPAFLERAGVSVAFVAWNDVPGVTRAGSHTPGVPWLTRANVMAAVQEARAGGAQVVICDPQWWGGAEYHSDLRNAQLDQLQWFEEAGCDAIIGAGTHLAGPVGLWRHGDQVGAMVASEGNFMFQQSFWQLTQEGVIANLSFRGPDLVNVRLVPYVTLDDARTALTDPTTDGRYVLRRVFANSDLAYTPLGGAGSTVP